MLQGGLHRRTLLGAAGSLACTRSVLGDGAPIMWYAGAMGGRTDPFVSWARETMQLRTGFRIRRIDRLEAADVVCVARPSEGPCTGLRRIAWRNGWVGLTRRGVVQAGAEQFAAFLAGEAATAHALALIQPA